MKYLVDNNKKFSKIGLGTARFGTKISFPLSEEMLDYYYDSGGNILDTARNYYEWLEDGRGKSEESIGKWIQNRNNRNQIRICTKGGLFSKGKTSKVDLSFENIREDLLQSKEALKTDYIDIYLLHKDQQEMSVEEIITYMQKIKEIGKIEKIGVANWKSSRVKAANDYAVKNGLEKFTIVQTWWSLAEYTKEMWDDDTTTHMDNLLYNYLKNEGLWGMAYTSQCKGYFQKAIQNGREHLDDFLRYRIETPINLKKLEYIDYFCSREKCTPTDVMLGYIVNNELPGIALASCSNVCQLKEVMHSVNYELKQDIIKSIDEIV